MINFSAIYGGKDPTKPLTRLTISSGNRVDFCRHTLFGIMTNLNFCQVTNHILKQPDLSSVPIRCIPIN
jgi:hypothetical protein